MITILCGSETHPIVNYVRPWIEKKLERNQCINLYFKHEDIEPYGVLFVLSYGRMLSSEFVAKFDHVIVLHASDLPKGRGWSPHIWDILNGASQITLCAINAADKVDEGDIWAKLPISIEPSDLYSDINDKLFRAEILLIEQVTIMIENGEKPSPQRNETPTYYPRRTLDDSRVEIDDTIESIFNLLRVADPNRFPVFFVKDGVRYNLILEKACEND